MDGPPRRLHETLHAADRTDVIIDELGANNHERSQPLDDDERDAEVSVAESKSEDDYAQEVKRPTVGVAQPGKMS